MLACVSGGDSTDGKSQRGRVAQPRSHSQVMGVLENLH